MPHSTSYPLLMLVLQNVLIKYTPFCTPKCSSYTGFDCEELVGVTPRR